MIVTDECESALDVMRDIVYDAIDKNIPYNTIGNIVVVRKDNIDDVMRVELSSVYQLKQFESEMLSEISDLSVWHINSLKRNNSLELLRLFVEEDLIKKVVTRYVDRDGYGDYFSCDGETYDIGEHYVFKFRDLDEL